MNVPGTRRHCLGCRPLPKGYKSRHLARRHIVLRRRLLDEAVSYFFFFTEAIERDLVAIVKLATRGARRPGHFKIVDGLTAGKRGHVDVTLEESYRPDSAVEQC